MKEGRLSGIEKQISHATNVTYGLIALIVVAIGIPAWRGKRDREQERKIDDLTREIETRNPTFSVRVSDTYGISTKNLLLTLRNCGLNKRWRFTDLNGDGKINILDLKENYGKRH